jgi:hypothetical protein
MLTRDQRADVRDLLAYARDHLDKVEPALEGHSIPDFYAALGAITAAEIRLQEIKEIIFHAHTR